MRCFAGTVCEAWQSNPGGRAGPDLGFGPGVAFVEARILRNAEDFRGADEHEQSNDAADFGEAYKSGREAYKSGREVAPKGESARDERENSSPKDHGLSPRQSLMRTGNGLGPNKFLTPC
jgi:hypothetical protein